MKKNLLLLAIILCLTSTAQIPKSTWKSIPNKTRILFITNGHPTELNFNTALNTIIDNNIEIDKHDRELGTITTAWTPLPRTGSYKLNIRCTDGRIQITGQLLSGISIHVGQGIRSEDSPEPIQKVRAQKSLYGIAFTQMYTIAQPLGTIGW